MKNIFFLRDSSSIIGQKYVNRSLFLAKKLKQENKNLKILFVTMDLPENINKMILEELR